MDENSIGDCMRYWATEDETWVLFLPFGTEDENKAWIKRHDPKLRVVRPTLTNKKTMLLVAFTGDGKFNVHATCPGDTITSERYIDFLKDVGIKWRNLKSSPTPLSQLW